MKKEKLDRIIKLVREEAPVNNVGGNQPMGQGKIASTQHAGDDPHVDLRKKKYRGWNPFFKNLAQVMRRK